MRLGPKTLLILLSWAILLPQAFAAPGGPPSYAVVCGFKNGPADEPEELSFVWAAEDPAQGPSQQKAREFPGAFKRLDLMGRERPDLLKISVKPSSFLRQAEDEFVPFRLSGLYTSLRPGEPHGFRISGKLQLDTANPHDSKIQLTFEEGGFGGFLGIFESRSGFKTDFMGAVCDLRRI